MIKSGPMNYGVLMNIKPIAALVLAGILLLASCQTGGKRSGFRDSPNRQFRAHTIVYNSVPVSVVQEKEFISQLEYQERGAIKSYRFSNYITRGERPDIVVTLAVSGRSAGLGIYNADNQPLMEYPQGVVMGKYVEFLLESEEGSSKIRWYLGDEKIFSVFESFNSDGMLGAAENTLYLLR